MSESVILKQVMKEVGSLPHVRIFRNQVGVGWVGQPAPLDDGRVMILNAQRVRMGLHVGSGDLIGWRTTIITPDDVGSYMAQFLSIEVKDKKGAMRPEQETWYKRISEAGGIAMIARDPHEARRLLDIR